MKGGKSGGDARLPAEFWKALSEDRELRVYLKEVMCAYWESGSFPESTTIPDSTPDLAEAIVKLARAKNWRVSWQQMNPKAPTSKSLQDTTSTNAPLRFQRLLGLAAALGTLHGTSNVDFLCCTIRRLSQALNLGSFRTILEALSIKSGVRHDCYFCRRKEISRCAKIGVEYACLT